MKQFAIYILFFFFASSLQAATMTVSGRHIRSGGNAPPRIEAKVFQITLGGAVIKKVRNSSNLGFVIEAEGGVILYKNSGESAIGIQIGPGLYRVFPFLQKGHHSDKVTIKLEKQSTGEWITEGGRQNLQRYRPGQ